MGEASVTNYMGVLEWKSHQGNTDYMQVADGILLAYPLPGGPHAAGPRDPAARAGQAG